jgi:hypothetical protein
MSSEKAGVGGSTPSLATINSVIYDPHKSEFCHTLFTKKSELPGVCLGGKC